MKKTIIYSFALLIASLFAVKSNSNILQENNEEVIMENTNASKSQSIYDFTVKNIDGKDVKLSDYKVKVILIVNVASKCGLTPQYEGLEKLYKQYKDKGFVILGFPCNQFLGQEPGENNEIKQFCSLTYDVSFPLFAKIDVNGEHTAPLYAYLKEKAPFVGYPEKYKDFGAQIDAIHQKTGTKYNEGNNIRWNFGKFLISKDGKQIKRFEPMVTPEEIAKDVEEFLSK